MAGTRSKIAREAREAVLRRIIAWINRQSGTQQAVCESLQMRASQLHTLVNEGAERCSLEYLLDVWERCGGTYSLVLSGGGAESSTAAHGEQDAGSLPGTHGVAGAHSAQGTRIARSGR